MEHQLDSDEREHALVVLRGLDRMRKEKKDCDLLLKVGNEELPVHKNVLRAQSEYFDAMFTHDTLESQSGVVEMKEMKFRPVKKCVDYFYTGKISTSDEECEDLLFTASLMQVEPVCDKIVSFLQSNLNPKSFFDARKIAIKFDLKNLNKVCDEFALDELDDIVKEEEFNQLEMEYVSQLITSKKSYDGNEDRKLAVVLQWVKTDVENRQKHLISLMQLINLKTISPGYARHLVESESIFSDSVKITSMLFLAMLDKQNVEPIPAPVRFSSSRDTDSILVFDISSNYLQKYRPADKSWQQMHPLITEMQGGCYCTAVVSEMKLFILLQKRKMFTMDLSSNRPVWDRVKDMLDDHGAAISATVYNDFIYAVGENCMERYSIDRNEWQKVSSDGIACNQCTLFAYDDSIYCIGGEKGHLGDVHKLSPKSTSWISLHLMQSARQTPAVTAQGSMLYVAGGYRDGSILSDVESYDIRNDAWTKMKPTVKCRSCFGLFAISDKLYAVGHYNDPCSIEAYDFKTDKWEEVLKQTDMKIIAQATVAIQCPH